MTAAKTRSGAAPAKGKSAKSAPARRAATTTPPKASVSKSAPAKAASKRPLPIRYMPLLCTSIISKQSFQQSCRSPINTSVLALKLNITQSSENIC